MQWVEDYIKKTAGKINSEVGVPVDVKRYTGEEGIAQIIFILTFDNIKEYLRTSVQVKKADQYFLGGTGAVTYINFALDKLSIEDKNSPFLILSDDSGKILVYEANKFFKTIFSPKEYSSTQTKASIAFSEKGDTISAEIGYLKHKEVDEGINIAPLFEMRNHSLEKRLGK